MEKNNCSQEYLTVIFPVLLEQKGEGKSEINT